MSDFGNRLHEIREDKGLTRRSLAKRVGVSVETLRKIEEGLTQSPRVHLAQKLADVLNVGIDSLLHERSKQPISGRSSVRKGAIIHQAQSTIFEIALPYTVTLTKRERNELARRLTVEFDIIHERQRQPVPKKQNRSKKA
jgi:transcriptional regulator with XRE-family HTH domain